MAGVFAACTAHCSEWTLSPYAGDITCKTVHMVPTISFVWRMGSLPTDDHCDLLPS